MRKWFGRLHGGQLLMLLVPTYLIGFGAMWIGYTLFLIPSNQGFAQASEFVGRDSLLYKASLHSAQYEGTVAFRFIGAGFICWLLTLPMIWWWLNARRRTPPV